MGVSTGRHSTIAIAAKGGICKTPLRSVYQLASRIAPLVRLGQSPGELARPPQVSRRAGRSGRADGSSTPGAHGARPGGRRDAPKRAAADSKLGFEQSPRQTREWIRCDT